MTLEASKKPRLLALDVTNRKMINTKSVLVASIGIFMGIAGFATVIQAPRIEGDLKDQAEAELSAGNHSAVRVRAQGRSLTASGVVAEAKTGSGLVTRLRDLRGVVRVNRTLAVGPSDTIELLTNGEHLTFRGVVPDYRTREILVSYAKEVYGRKKVHDHTALVDGPIDLSWPNMMRTLIERSADFGPSKITMADNTITVIIKEGGSRNYMTQMDAHMEDLKSRLETGFVLRPLMVRVPLELTPDECESQMRSISKNNGIEFDSGTAIIRPDGRHVIRQVSAVVKVCEGHRLVVVGHTDASGSERSNVALSVKRASAVNDLLVSTGVDAKRIEFTGVGSAEPISENDTPEGKASNRRIEFELVDDSQ